MNEKVPATVLTGYLGSGKTTLLNRILTGDHGKRIAVIVNEFGEIGIDHQIISTSQEEIIEMNNGCICCRVRGDLIRIVDDIFRRDADIDHVVIETTGLADPGPIIQSFLVDDRVNARLDLDAIIALVDAKHLALQIGCVETVEQIAFADVIVINKTDIASAQELRATEKTVTDINKFAKVYKTRNAEIGIEKIVGIRSFDIDNVLRVDPGVLDETEHDHDTSVTSFATSRPGVLDGALFSRWIFDLGQEYGQNLFRMKGVLNIDDASRRFVFQGVHMTFNGQPGKLWDPNEPRKNELVVIGRDLDRDKIQSGFDGCFCVAAEMPASALTENVQQR